MVLSSVMRFRTKDDRNVKSLVSCLLLVENRQMTEKETLRETSFFLETFFLSLVKFQVSFFLLVSVKTSRFFFSLLSFALICYYTFYYYYYYY